LPDFPQRDRARPRSLKKHEQSEHELSETLSPGAADPAHKNGNQQILFTALDREVLEKLRDADLDQLKPLDPQSSRRAEETNLMSKKPMLVLGMMSGTSADGIDVALARISGAPPNLNAKLLGHTSGKFPPALRREILRIAEQQSISAGELSQLNFRLGELFAAAALSACRNFACAITRCAYRQPWADHLPSGPPYSLFRFANRLHATDRRALGHRRAHGDHHCRRFSSRRHCAWRPGRAARPYADYLLYRHAKLGRVSLNLGGIANITVLPRAASPGKIFAFDTGPANMLIDALVSHFTRGRRRFDENAHFALQGRSTPRSSTNFSGIPI